MVTLEEESGHGLFKIVQAKTLVPTVKPVMVVVGDNEFVIAPLPETKVH